MRKNEQRRVEVCAHWSGMNEPVRVGVLYAAPARGKEIFSFEYDPAWLRTSYARALDPHLGLYEGPQYAPDTHPNFGVFLMGIEWGPCAFALLKADHSSTTTTEMPLRRGLH